jgi:hypothetical protein
MTGSGLGAGPARLGERRFVAISGQRDVTAYLRLGAFLAARDPGQPV